MEINNKKIEDLIPYINNAKLHPEEQVSQIAASIKEFGFINPIIIDKDNGIIAGHGRLQGAQKLGLKEVPCLVADHLSETQKKAYILADNKIGANSGFDEEMLKIEIDFLEENDFDIDLTGFEFDELEEMFEGLGEEGGRNNGENDEIPEPEETPIIKNGDLIELGQDYQHRLLCGDSTNEEVVSKLMDGKKSDMVFTDPPYLMNFTGSVQGDGSMSSNSKHGKIKNDKMSKEDGDIFLDNINKIIKNYNKGAFYITFYRLGIGKYWASMDRIGLETRALIIWNKGNHTLSNSDYMSKYEPMFYGWCNDHKFYGGNNGMDIWDIKRTQKNDLHPTMKPIELVEKALEDGSKKKDIVLDLFGGSGTTMIASENLNRCARLMELDEKYAQVIIQRYVDYTSNPKIKINGVEVDWHDFKEENK